MDEEQQAQDYLETLSDDQVNDFIKAFKIISPDLETIKALDNANDDSTRP